MSNRSTLLCSTDDRLREKMVKDRIHIGTSVLHYPHWVGRLYSKGTTPEAFDAGYACEFGSIWIDKLFYRLPRPEILVERRDGNAAHNAEIGSGTARSAARFLCEGRNRRVLDRVGGAAGKTCPVETSGRREVLTGVTFVFTGALKGLHPQRDGASGREAGRTHNLRPKCQYELSRSQR